MNVETLVDAPPALANLFARRLEGLVSMAPDAGRRFAIALPGGSVAEAFLPVLAAATLEWKRIDVFWADERAVPEQHADSNYGLARRLLLERAAGARFHRIRGEAPDIQAAAAEYEAELRTRLGDPPALDVALLGVGADGHVCSLFDGHAALHERTRLVVAVQDSPKPPPRRITLTLPALRQARLLVVAAFGAAKADVVRRALRDPGARLPVALALRQAARALVLLDAASASAAQVGTRR